MKMWDWEITLTYAYEGKRGRYSIVTDGENGWILCCAPKPTGIITGEADGIPSISYRDNEDEEHFIAWTRTVIEAQMRAYNFDCE